MQAPPPVANLLMQLATTAASFGGILPDASLDWTWRPAPDQWSLTEIGCHLRDVELEVHQVRFRAVLRSPGAFLAGVSADAWANERDYQRQSGPTAVADFLEARKRTIDLLTSLPGEAWALEGQHAFFGRTSLHELLAMIVRHDDLHWAQFKEVTQLQRQSGRVATPAVVRESR